MGEREPHDLPPILGPVCLGLLVAVLAILVAAIVATSLLFIGLDWAAYLHAVGITIAFSAIALGAVWAGSRAGGRGWLVGLVTGGSLILFCFIFCLLGRAKGVVPSLALVRIAAACITGAIGGILGVNLGGGLESPLLAGRRYGRSGELGI